ncbi:MAG: tRNA (N(6)-L-threonylcarbamoyladenosine(37)-C(2))-methylthiotransferase MtaB [Nitrospirae bacterium]|nr:MAG: tRNA (N(6)-L-threonylcarbamoyladenosine(37)-C(2))-methylthiotransferase MtaB [Nitrospirota bacterium]
MHEGTSRSLMKTVAVHTIGCRLNQAETALLVNRFEELGYHPVPFGHPTDLLVVNTCTVTEEAEQDCWRAVRQTLRHSPHAIVAVTGCYAQTGRDRLRQLPGVDFIIGNQYKMQLPDVLHWAPRWKKRLKPTVLHSPRLDRAQFMQPGVGRYQTTRANLKIQDGCNFRCAFCLIPTARGRERSRVMDDALREAEQLVARGHRELVLTGVNIGRYREGDLDLLALIQRLERIAGLERIRISSIEPTTIPDGLLEYMASSPKLCRHLHVPLQSGDNAILQAMRRRYMVRDYVTWVERAAQCVPGLCLGTDLLVGFPGEEDPQFANTLAIAKELPFAYFHVFRYSPRPGTAAARLPRRVPPAVIRERARLLNALSRAKRLAFYQTHIGQTVRVLVEANDKHGVMTGLTDNYVKVGIPGDTPGSNQLVTVTITGVTDGLALGQLQVGAQRPSRTLRIFMDYDQTSAWQRLQLESEMVMTSSIGNKRADV